MRPFKIIAAALLLSLSLLATLPAQVATDPVGFTTLTVNAKPASKAGITLLSLDMTQLPLFQGVVTSVSTNGSNQTVLTFPASTFGAGTGAPYALAPNNGGNFGTHGTHFVELTNGTNAGLITDIVSNTDSTLTLAGNITAAIAGGTSTIKIRPNWTIGAVFGTNNSAGLLGGASATAGDVISIVNPANNFTTNIFYNTNSNQWQSGLSPAANFVVPYGAGLSINRKLGSAVSFQLVGAVKLGTTGIFIQGGSAKNLNYVANPYPLSSVTLANSNLYTGDPTTGLAGGASASAADNLSVYDTNNGFTNYFFNTNTGHWQTGLSQADTVTIPDGAAVLITRKNNGTSFVWYVPQPTINLN